MDRYDVRPLRESDYEELIAAIPRWWADSRSPDRARELALSVPRLFCRHFVTTSFVASADARLVRFLVGFFSPADDAECYVHLVGVDPDLRGRGIGRQLYSSFNDLARADGRRTVRAVTAPTNHGSVEFHRSLGFALDPGDRLDSDLPVRRDYDGPGQDRICFRLQL